MNKKTANVDSDVIKKKIFKRKNRRVNAIDSKPVVFNKKRERQIIFSRNHCSTLNSRDVFIFSNNSLFNNFASRYKTKLAENKNNKTFIQKRAFTSLKTNTRCRFDFNSNNSRLNFFLKIFYSSQGSLVTNFLSISNTTNNFLSTITNFYLTKNLAKKSDFLFALKREQNQKNVQNLLRRKICLFVVKFVAFFNEFKKAKAQIEKLTQKVNELIIQNKGKDELLHREKQKSGRRFTARPYER